MIVIIRDNPHPVANIYEKGSLIRVRVFFNEQWARFIYWSFVEVNLAWIKMRTHDDDVVWGRSESCHWLYLQALIIYTIHTWRWWRHNGWSGEKAACVSAECIVCVPRGCVHCSGTPMWQLKSHLLINAQYLFFNADRSRISTTDNYLCISYQTTRSAAHPPFCLCSAI